MITVRGNETNNKNQLRKEKVVRQTIKMKQLTAKLVTRMKR